MPHYPSTDLAQGLRKKAADHLGAARSLVESYDGLGMPNAVAATVKQHIAAAEDFKKQAAAEQDARDSEPMYRRSMLADGDTKDLVPGSGGAPDGRAFKAGAPEGCYSRPLPAEAKVRDVVGGADVSEDALMGALGVLVKSQVVPVSEREAAHFGRLIGAKSMLTSGSAGAVVPDSVAAYVIDMMRARIVVAALGARTVPMATKEVRIPRVTGDMTPQWLAEGAALTPSDATLDSVTLTAQRLDGEVKVSMELEEDSDPVGIGQVVSQSIAAAMALKIDAAALRGSGTPPEPRGIRNTSGVTLIAPGANGDALTYDTLLALVKAVTQANAEPTGFAMTPGAAITLNGLKEATTNAYLQPPALLGPNGLNLRSETTTAIPSNLTKGSGTALTEVYAGDFRQLLIGLRVGMQIQVARELHRESGLIGIFGRMRADIGVEHGAAFAVATHVDD